MVCYDRLRQSFAQVAERFHHRRVDRHVGKFLHVDGLHEGIVCDVFLVTIQDFVSRLRELMELRLVANGGGGVLVEGVAQLIVKAIENRIDLFAALDHFRILSRIRKVRPCAGRPSLFPNPARP